ncbi:MAG: septum site-determining protein MinC [Firmicutes bacterium]|nr:septum site-determining protein MinC [Bacillota bacterium]
MTADFLTKDNLPQGNTMLIEGPLRSGHKVDYDGNVVVMGDVNAGAEVRASGHVMIFGALRGMVHGGAKGDVNAKVLALMLFPTQLRIADHITCPPEGYEEIAGRGPEIAALRDDKVVIEQLAF